MATDSQSTGSAQAPPKADPPAAKSAEPQEDRYGLEGWSERAHQLDASPHAVAGALHGKDPEELLTKGQVHALLEAFYERPGVEEAAE